jgi:hypothetical protein
MRFFRSIVSPRPPWMATVDISNNSLCPNNYLIIQYKILLARSVNEIERGLC